MRFDRIEIQGFRAFSWAQTLDLSTMRPGLYLVTGENQVEPELGSNGIGKSSLFEAFDWALTGKTSRGLRAGDVRNWRAEAPCVTILEGATAAGGLALMRAWQPNALEVAVAGSDPRPIDQPQLEQLIGIPPAALRYAIHFAQFAPAFVDLGAAQQTALFASIMQLDLWEQVAGRASDYAIQVEQARAEINTEAARLDGQIAEIDMANYEMDEAGWASAHKQQIAKAKAVWAKCQEEADATPMPIVDESGLRQQQKLLQVHIGTQARLRRDVEIASAKIEELEQSNYNVCPTCGAKCDQKHVRAEIKKYKREGQEAAAALLLSSKRVADLQKAVAAEQAALADQYGAREAHNVAAARAAQAKQEYERTQRQANPYTAKRKAAEKRRGELSKQLDALTADLADIEQELAGAKFWVRGFKEIRLQQIQQSLAQLEVEANEALFQLGLRDWSIEFAVERENKSGGIAKAFTTMVRAPHTAGAVPWEAWSGGEAQRLRLAISMGFANLVCGRLGVQPNLELWDEPSTWLNANGIQDLLTVLADRAERLGKVLLLADHRALDFGRFAGAVRIVKEENGSLIHPPV